MSALGSFPSPGETGDLARRYMQTLATFLLDAIAFQSLSTFSLIKTRN